MNNTDYTGYVKQGIHRIRFCISMPQVSGLTREHPYKKQLKLAWLVWCEKKYQRTPSKDQLSNPNHNISQDEYGLVLEQRVSGRAKHIDRSLDIYVDDSREDLIRAVKSIHIPKEERPPIDDDN